LAAFALPRLSLNEDDVHLDGGVMKPLVAANALDSLHSPRLSGLDHGLLSGTPLPLLHDPVFGAGGVGVGVGVGSSVGSGVGVGVGMSGGSGVGVGVGMSGGSGTGPGSNNGVAAAASSLRFGGALGSGDALVSDAGGGDGGMGIDLGVGGGDGDYDGGSLASGQCVICTVSPAVCFFNKTR
jgi:hypothetical protein